MKVFVLVRAEPLWPRPGGWLRTVAVFPSHFDGVFANRPLPLPASLRAAGGHLLQLRKPGQHQLEVRDGALRYDRLNSQEARAGACEEAEGHREEEETLEPSLP